MALFVARHAPTRVDAGTCVGQLDLPSLRDSHEVAEELLSSCNGVAEIGEVWSSPLRRCSEVAQILASRWSVPHRTDARLLEISYGRWEGRRWTEIEQAEAQALQVWMKAWEQQGPPGGESAAAIAARLRSWWRVLDGTQDLVLIAHAGVIRALKVITGECSWNEAMQVAVPHLRWHRFDP